MTKTIETRLRKLEQAIGADFADVNSARRIAAALLQIGHSAPPVLQGQTGEQYLKTIPTDALKALLEAKP